MKYETYQHCDSLSSVYQLLKRPLVIAVCKGRPLAYALQLLEKVGILPQKTTDDARCYTYAPLQWEGVPVQVTEISPRDMAAFLANNTADVVAGFDDGLHNLAEKNYQLKPTLAETRSVCESRIAIVGPAANAGMSLKERMAPLTEKEWKTFCAQPRLRIASEYLDVEARQSSFRVWRDAFPEATWIHCNGNAEGMVGNGLADAALTIVETGQTLEANNMRVYNTLRTITPNLWVNTDCAYGLAFYRTVGQQAKVMFFDGIDGSGKDTVIGLVQKDHRFKEYVLVNRSEMTRRTLLSPEEPGWFAPLPEGTHVLLDVKPLQARARIMKRQLQSGTPINELWESTPALCYFQQRFHELIAYFGGICVDTSPLSPSQVHDAIWEAVTRASSSDFVVPEMRVMTHTKFMTLPEVAHGESKWLRKWNDRFDILLLIPSIYSHKNNRQCKDVEGSDKERRRMMRAVRHILAWEQIAHTYWFVGEPFLLVECLEHTPPPVEVVVKKYWEGTDKYRMPDLVKHRDWQTGKWIVNPETHEYETPYVRFDWRNSNDHKEGDVGIADQLAQRVINVEAARQLALRTFEALKAHLAVAGIELWDICFFVTASGSHIFGEITQDNARYKKRSSEASTFESRESTPGFVNLDKDAWRTGNSQEDVLARWAKLGEIVCAYTYALFATKFASMK